MIVSHGCVFILILLLFFNIFFFFYIYIYFGCARSSLLRGLFSSCSEWGLLSSCGAQASSCSGFSCCGARALGHLGSGSCNSRALEHRLNSCGAWTQLLCGMWAPPWSRDQTRVSCIGRQILHHRATREALGNHLKSHI